MDSHYEQVMRERAAAGGPARRYFGYATILDRAAFDAWRGQHGYDFFTPPPGQPAEALDTGLVFDFPSRFFGGRVAGLAPQPGATVHGLLFDIAAVDWPIIRHKEGALTQMCEERVVRVRAGGEEHEAVAFTTRPQRVSMLGPVSAPFVAALLRGARSAGLPAAWLEEIERRAR